MPKKLCGDIQDYRELRDYAASIYQPTRLEKYLSVLVCAASLAMAPWVVGGFPEEPLAVGVGLLGIASLFLFGRELRMINLFPALILAWVASLHQEEKRSIIDKAASELGQIKD